MDDPVSFSKLNVDTINHARFFLNKYKDLLKFKENEDILEVGCASGIITKEVLFPFVEKYVNTLLGTDISQNAADMANSLYSGPKISFRQMDIEEEHLWEKYDEKFGHIFAFYVIHMLKYPERWSINLFKMLKREGQFFGYVLLPPHQGDDVLAAQKADKTAPWAKYLENVPNVFTDYGPDPSGTIANILSSAGFIVNLKEIQTVSLTFGTTEQLNGVMLSINPFLKHIPEALRDAYLEDYFKKTSEHFQPSGDGSYKIPLNVLSILATKE